jgi:hemolysin activation/secretion protein
VGAQRGIATIEHQSLTGNADTFTLSYGRSEGLDPLLDVRYAIPLTARDTTLVLESRRNDLTVVEEPFDQLDIQSESQIYTVSLWQPVYRTPSTLFALELTGERSSLDTSILGVPFSLEPGAVEGESVVSVLRFAQEYVQRTRTQVVAARSRFSLGVDALDSTIHADDELPDSQFFAWLGQFQWVRWFDALKRIGVPETQVLLRSDLQLSNRPLLTLEQIALGGRYTVRGYPQNTLVRDNAFLASLESRIPMVRNKRWADYLELAPFVDYGNGWNSDRSTPHPRDLSSVGIGLRWGASLRARVPLRAQAEIYWGYPMRTIETPAKAFDGDGIQFQFIVGYY